MARIIVLAPKGSTVSVSGENILIKDTRDKYTWYESDWPTTSSMETYLKNVSAIRSALAVLPTTPNVPEDMKSLLVKEANDIEQILLDVSRQTNIMVTTFIPSGEALSGGDNL